MRNIQFFYKLNSKGIYTFEEQIYKLSAQTYRHLNNSIMIKAPFRFDVEYFSIVVTYALSPSPVKHFFRDQKEKDNYLSTLRKSGNVSPQELKEISLQNFFLEDSHCKPCLYIIVQNTGTKDFYCSFTKNEELSVELKAIFGDLISLYTFIRQNCNSDKIKLTKNGNIIIYYSIQETVYTLKLQNYPTSFKRVSIQDIWDTIKESWDRRKETGQDRSLQQCFNSIRKGNISVYGKAEQRASKLSSSDMSAEESHPYQRQRIKEKKYFKDKNQKTAKTAVRREDSSDQEEGNVAYSSKRYEPYEDDRSPYSSYKSKTIFKEYPGQFVEKKRYKPKYKSERKIRQGRYYEEEDDSSYEPVKREKIVEYPPINIEINQLLGTIKKDLEEVKKATTLYSQLETTINQNLEAKFELFGNTLKQSLGILETNLQTLPERINQNEIMKEFSDDDSKNAYLMFYADKMPVFRANFQLKDSSLIQQYLKKVWNELSLAQKSKYFKQIKGPLNEEPLKVKKSGKGEPGQLEHPFQEGLDSKSQKDLIESMEEEQASVNNEGSEGSGSKNEKSDY